MDRRDTGDVAPTDRIDAVPVGDELDDHVAELAVGGDPAAFEIVYRALQPRLHRYAWSLVGQDADDVCAEAWLQIARDLRGFRGDVDGLRGWTARIVRNRSMDLLRARSRRPADPVPVEDLLEARTDDAAETVALDRLSTRQAVQLIAMLPPDQAEAVMLRAVVGLDAATAATVLGKRPGAVRTAAHRGLKRLAKHLEADR